VVSCPLVVVRCSLFVGCFSCNWDRLRALLSIGTALPWTLVFRLVALTTGGKAAKLSADEPPPRTMYLGPLMLTTNYGQLTTDN